MRCQRASLSILTAFLLACASSALSAPQLDLGMCIAIHDISPATIAAAQSIGVKSLRIDIPWAQVEKAPRKLVIPSYSEELVTMGRAAGMEPLLILDYGNPIYGSDKPRTKEAIEAFAYYAETVVNHFKGRVRYFELWNEWETHTGGTTAATPQEYIAFAKIVYPAIKRADPSATVLMSGISDLAMSGLRDNWIAQFVRLGGLAYVDGLSLHPYTAPHEDPKPEARIALVDAIYSLAKEVNPRKDVQIYITEMGYYTSTTAGSVSEEQQAQHLTRFALLAFSRSYIHGLWWYQLKNQGADLTNKEKNFGLFSATLTPKPAARMYKALALILNKYPDIEAQQNGDNYTVSLRNGSDHQLVTWSDNGGSRVMISPASDPTNQRPLQDLAGTVGIP